MQKFYMDHMEQNFAYFSPKISGKRVAKYGVEFNFCVIGIKVEIICEKL